jgi:hypothetical protein
VAEEPVRVLIGPQLLAVDGQDVVTHGGLDAHLGEGRPVAGLLVVAGEDPADPVATAGRVELEAGARERHVRPLGLVPVAAGDVGVLDRQLGDHLGDEVVQVRAVGHVGQERPVLLAQRLPVVAVHVLHVEEVAVATPDLVEDLGPLVGGNAVHVHAPGGDGLLRAPAASAGVVEDEVLALPGPGPSSRRPTWWPADALGQGGLGTIGQGEDL